MSPYNAQLMALRRRTHYALNLKACMEILRLAGGDVDLAADLLLNQDATCDLQHLFGCDVPEGAPRYWLYVMCKAKTYLKLGPERYRRLDAINMPDEDWDENTLAEIASCFQQFLDGKGWHPDCPVEHVSLDGFYDAAQTLFFFPLQQNTHACDQADDGSTACIYILEMEEVGTDNTLTFYYKGAADQVRLEGPPYEGPPAALYM